VSKYIIGGGITGLIASFYNPDYRIITDKIGGQMAANTAGPRILEVNEYSRMFLKDLGFENVNTKFAKIGYKVRGKIVDSISKSLRNKYYLKSRCLDDANLIPNSIMSDGKNTIEYFDISWDEIIERLISNIKKPVINKITSIDTEEKIIVLDGLPFRYEKLISTIPAPAFFKASKLNPEKELKFIQKVFIIVDSSTIDMREYEYIYYPECQYPYHRISKVGSNKLSIEFTTNEDTSKILNYWKHISIQNIIIPIGQIQSGMISKVKDISFFGRYACWDHDLKVDDVIRQSIDYNDTERKNIYDGI
jgi:hypothetical protein